MVGVVGCGHTQWHVRRLDGESAIDRPANWADAVSRDGLRAAIAQGAHQRTTVCGQPWIVAVPRVAWPRTLTQQNI